MKILSIKDVRISFGRRCILEGIDLEVASGAMVSISGKSGSGKTTLLSIISGLLKPESGEVLFKGEDIFSWSDFRRSRYRNRKIGFIFQSFNLLPDISVYHNILYPAILNPLSRDIKGEVEYLIQCLDIKDVKDQYPSTLSGGEKQRAAIGRALVNRPEIILADEPTGNLDEKTGKSVFAILNEINKKDGIIVIVATHDRYIIKNSDFHYRLDLGKLIPKKR